MMWDRGNEEERGGSLCKRETERQEEVFDVLPSPERAFGADARSEACPSA